MAWIALPEPFCQCKQRRCARWCVCFANCRAGRRARRQRRCGACALAWSHAAVCRVAAARPFVAAVERCRADGLVVASSSCTWLWCTTSMPTQRPRWLCIVTESCTSRSIRCRRSQCLRAGAAALSIGGGDRDGATLPLPFDVEQVRLYDSALSADDIRIVYAAEHCSNGLMDGGERGVDCGDVGSGCVSCADRCANGVVDGDETDVDCGGIHCAVCAGAPQVAVLARYAPRDRRRLLAGMILGGNGGRSSQITISLMHGRSRLRSASVAALSGVSHEDAGGRCIFARSRSVILSERGLLPNNLYHTTDADDACEHSWRDSSARAAVVVDLGQEMRIDELRLMNWNVVNTTEFGRALARHRHCEERRWASSL
jgi:hypothetical protein